MILIGARHSKGRRRRKNISVAFKWPMDISWLVIVVSSNFPVRHSDQYLSNFCQTRANFTGFAGMSDTFRHLCSWMTVLTPTDRLKSVSSHCVIEVFAGIFLYFYFLMVWGCFLRIGSMFFFSPYIWLFCQLLFFIIRLLLIFVFPVFSIFFYLTKQNRESTKGYSRWKVE